MKKVAQQEKKVSGREVRLMKSLLQSANKRKKLETEKKAEAKVRPLDKKKGKSVKNRSFEHSSLAVSTSGLRKKTADGLAVFSEEELGIGKPDAGGTALCPFDCDSCF
ncbi:uncharacterized protein C6G9.01c-like [Salvia splendens]|uniref:uncharacterized protein C6G9.01c-like n=1 Tax=Salvia splendens TaxID=180675 RepID=UPI001C2595B3|nr:uncharacterized protein C6G9.01c-like [Salvia splendens]